MKFLRNLSNGSREQEDVASSLEAELQQLLQGPGPDEFYSAMLSLQKLGEIALPRLKEVATDSNQPSGFRARALETVAMIRGKGTGTFLMQCATDPEFQVRWSAVSMIGKLRVQEALPLLKKLLRSDNTEWEIQPGFVLSMNKALREAIAAIEQVSK